MSGELSADEKPLVTAIVEHNRRMMEASATDGVHFLRRAQHPKHHGCVGASFVVASDVPEDLRHGVFAKPGQTFTALVRFSNGRAQDDSEADAHGMAIKLLDVEGKRLKDLEWQTSQDFVLVDDELFFSGKLDEYEKINRAIADGQESFATQLLPKALAKILVGVKLKIATKPEDGKGRIGEGEHDVVDALRAFAGQKPSSPLASHYWSTTPYRLGDQVVKYMAVSGRAWERRAEEVGPSYLAEALTRELAQGGISFEFVVHVHSNEKLHPIDEPDVSWSQNGARTVRLARIDIPPQEVASGSVRAERIVMSPWNCLEAHEPLGKINLARRDVYEELAEVRLGKEFREWVNMPANHRYL
jgi:hypothetical protein